MDGAVGIYYCIFIEVAVGINIVEVAVGINNHVPFESCITRKAIIYYHLI